MNQDVSAVVRIARWACVMAAAIGLLLTVFRSYEVSGFACCGWAFWYLALRIALDFVLVPGLCAWLVTASTGKGRALLWAACVYLGAFVYLPFFIPISLLCVWAQFRWMSYQKESGKSMSADHV